MPDDLQSRRRLAAAAARERRGYLGLTQAELANRAGVATRTIQSLEAKAESAEKGTWPNAVTRARIEKALGWKVGELHRLSSPARDIVDPQLVDRLRELTAAEREWSIRFLEGLRDAEAEGRRRRQGG